METLGRGVSELLTQLRSSSPTGSVAAAVDPTTAVGHATVAYVEAMLERLSSGGERRKVKIAKVCIGAQRMHHTGIYRSRHSYSNMLIVAIPHTITVGQLPRIIQCQACGVRHHIVPFTWSCRRSFS